jgi:hypothetical protein
VSRDYWQHHDSAAVACKRSQATKPVTWLAQQDASERCMARRNPREYFAIFDAATATQPDGRRARFELVSCKCVDTYVRVKHNQNQARPGGGRRARC